MTWIIHAFRVPYTSWSVSRASGVCWGNLRTWATSLCLQTMYGVLSHTGQTLKNRQHLCIQFLAVEKSSTLVLFWVLVHAFAFLVLPLSGEYITETLFVVNVSLCRSCLWNNLTYTLTYMTPLGTYITFFKRHQIWLHFNEISSSGAGKCCSELGGLLTQSF